MLLTFSRPGVADHGDREREGQRVPGGDRAEVDPVRQGAPREQEGEAEHRQAHLHDQVERGHRHADRVGIGAPRQPHRRHHHQDRHGQGRGLPHRELARPPERARHVVRQKQRRERHRDHEVEHRRPSGDEAGQVAPRPPRERRGATRLGDRGAALGVRGGREGEQQAGRQEHNRRQREGIDRRDAEGVVERRGDLAVGHRVERRGAQEPAQRRDLARHAGRE